MHNSVSLFSILKLLENSQNINGGKNGEPYFFLLFIYEYSLYIYISIILDTHKPV